MNTNQQNQAEQEPIKDKNINDSGWLDVGDGHQIYWVDWGNPKVKEPIFFLHGGPGSGFDQKSFQKFNPQAQRVIFHDQRGSSRSTPFASFENNTTEHLISDINKLKTHLKFDKISLFGFSWGSTLALLYAIANPDVINKILVGSIYLGRQEDNDFLLKGGIKTHFPEVWEKFASLVPEEHRDRAAEYYKEKMFGENEAERSKYARAWMGYEASILWLDYRPLYEGQDLSDFASESIAYLEAHYILNGCFIESNYILENAAKIAHIPTVIVHGRYDFICRPSGAIDLQKAIGDKATLQVVASGHASREPILREVTKAYTNMFWR